MIPFREYHLLQLLKDYDQKPLPLDVVMNHYFRAHKALGSKDRACVAQTAYDLVRWKGLVDALYPDASWREKLSTLDDIKDNLEDPVLKYKSQLSLHNCVSFPKDLFECIVKSYGEDKAIELCLASNHPAPTFVRANSLKINRSDLLKIWKDLPVRPTKTSNCGIIFDRKMNFFTLDEFKKGFFEVQDEGSQLLANLVNAQPGDQFMDFCSGSGGKSLAIAPKMENRGQIYLHDIRKEALQEAKKRLRRAGVENGQITLDQSPKLTKLKKKMDWVLVDAPCSGTGTLRRNPDMKWRFSHEMLSRLVSKQRVIFEKALSYLKPDGSIVYATCSLLKEENQEQLEHFLKTYPLKLIGDPFQSFPKNGEMDGFYGVVFKKTLQ